MKHVNNADYLYRLEVVKDYSYFNGATFVDDGESAKPSNAMLVIEYKEKANTDDGWIKMDRKTALKHFAVHHLYVENCLSAEGYLSLDKVVEFVDKFERVGIEIAY